MRPERILNPGVRNVRINTVLVAMMLLAVSAMTPAQKPDGLSALEQGDLPTASRLLRGEIEHELAREGERTAAQRARAEASALRLMETLDDTLDPRGFLDWARRTGERPAWPRLRGLLSEVELAAARLAADVEAMRAVRERRGAVSAWAFVGPFDNERGGGFDVAHAPESGFDAEAELEGKDRRLRWRRLDVDVPDGRYHVVALMHPARQAVAYFQAAVHAREASDALLWLGVEGASKAFVNGREVASNPSPRSFAFDQDLVPVRLEEGWNALLIKVAAQDSPGLLAARLTDAQGAARADWRVSNAFDDIARAAKTRAKAPPGLEPADAEAELLAHARAGRASIAELRDLSCLRTRRRTSERERREHAAVLEQHLARAARSPDLLVDLADALDARARMQAEREDNRRRVVLESALEADPGHVPALEALARHYLYVFPLPSRARGLVERLIAAAPRHPDAHMMRLALTVSDRGVPAALRAAARALDEDGIVSPRITAWLASQLMREGRLREAEARLMPVLEARRGDGRLRSLLRNLRLRQDRAPQVEALWREELALTPLNAEVYLRVARYHEGRDDLEKALDVVSSGLDVSPDSRPLLRAAADFNHRLGRDVQARAFLERLLEVYPGDKDARRYAQYLDRDERPFEDDYALALEEHLGSAGDWQENPDDASHRYLVHETIIRVNPDGTALRFRRDLIQVLNEAGVRRFDGVPLRLQRGQALRVRRARVHRAGGGISECDVSAVGFFGGWVDVPPLSPGDVIELAWRTDDLGQSYFGNYFGYEYLFRPGIAVACRLSRFRLILPRSREWYFHRRNGAPEPERKGMDGDDELLTWEMRDLPRIEVEARMPPLHDVSPLVQVSSYRDWDSFAAWWWNLVKEQLVVTDAMRAKVAELTAGLTTTREKIRAVYEWVASDIRYVAWEFGVHGYKPYKASAIFERRFGDCKDKAILINTLLREVGIETYPVLINAAAIRPIEDLTLPLVRHFNHCIVYVPAGEDHEERFLDGTAEFHPYDVLPAGDRGARVVVVRDGRAEVKDIPDHDPATSGATVDLEAELEPDGSARAHVSLAFQGLLDVEMRARLETRGDRRPEMERWLGDRLGEVTFRSLEVSDLRDLSRPVEVGIDLDVPALATRRGERLELKLSFEEAGLSRLANRDSRKYDLVLPPWPGQESRASYRLPAGWRLESPPDPIEVTNDFGRYRLSVDVEGENVLVRRELRLTKRRVPAADYARFREFCHLVDRADADSLVLIEDAK